MKISVLVLGFCFLGIQSSALIERNNEPFLSCISTTKAHYLVRSSLKLKFLINAKEGFEIKEYFTDADRIRFSGINNVFPTDTSNWSMMYAPDSSFYTWSPQKISFKKENVGSKLKIDSNTYLTKDITTGNTFTIIKKTFSTYYSAQSKQEIFESEIKNIITEKDSLVLLETTDYSQHADFMVYTPISNKFKRVRLKLNGKNIYIITGFFSLNNINSIPHKFFTSFQFTHPQSSNSLFISKNELLLKDLQSEDLGTRKKASQFLYEKKFTKADLPFFHKAIVTKFGDMDGLGYSIIYNTIVTKFDTIMDESTLLSIQENYPLANGTKEIFKMQLLKLLAKFKTKQTYTLLKKLALQSPPKMKTWSDISYEIRDSLELSKELLPEFFDLITDSIMGNIVLQLTNNLIDSNLISKETIDPYIPRFIKFIQNKINTLLQETTTADTEKRLDYNVLHFLQMINTDASNAILEQLLLNKSLFIKEEAVFALLKKGKSVDSKHLLSLAANDKHRYLLYNELKNLNLEKLFPKVFFTQMHMAKAELCQTIYENENPLKSIIFVEETTTMYLGSKKKFLLFNVVFKYSSSLGVIGPFEINSIKPEHHTKASGVYYDEPYSAKNKYKLLANYLKYLESIRENDNIPESD